MPNFTQTFFGILLSLSPVFCTIIIIILYIIVIGGDHSIPSSMETKWPCSFPDMISRNSRIDREDLANTMMDRMHGIRSLFTASQLKTPDDNNDDNDDDSYL